MWSLELQGVNTDGSSAPYFFGMMGAAIAMVFSSEPRVAHAHTRTHMMTGADEGGGGGGQQAGGNGRLAHANRDGEQLAIPSLGKGQGQGVKQQRTAALRTG